ncbi:MAG: hypothetical protein KTR18_09435 [Acidiferrobacterales bacterium]|nr:hypothetical protein [Acidiferrobacterales bacterium]
MAKPGKQHTLRKEIYQRVQTHFEGSGLQFARKEVRVKLDDNQFNDLSLQQKSLSPQRLQMQRTRNRSPRKLVWTVCNGPAQPLLTKP